jgi:hypothetical protein
LEEVDQGPWDGEDNIESEKTKQDDVDMKDKNEGVNMVGGASRSKGVCARHGEGIEGRTKCDSLATEDEARPKKVL